VGACRHADLATFSFHPVKAIAMGEGGAIASRDPSLAARMKRLRSHGMERDPACHEMREQAFDASGRPNPWYYEMQEVGLNYRAPDILCALARSQLRRLPAFLAHRAALEGRYRAALAASPAPVRALARVPHGRPAWHLAVALVDFAAAGMSRGKVMRRLRAAGYGTQVHYLPVHRQPYYARRYGRVDLAGADAYYERCLSLPFHMRVGLEEADRVVAALEAALRS
jgi:dTDP-4-amino-4,6-dideoxygalactose transaminase